MYKIALLVCIGSEDLPLNIVVGGIAFKMRLTRNIIS